MTDTNTIFAAFIEADKALKELPSVKAELDETKALAQSYADDLGKERNHNADLTTIIAQLRADLAAREEALNDATKSRDEHSAKLDSLRGLLGIGTRTDLLVQSKSEPVAETQGQSASDPTLDTSATSSVNDSSPTTGNGEQSPLSSTLHETTHEATHSTSPEVANTAPTDPTSAASTSPEPSASTEPRGNDALTSSANTSADVSNTTNGTSAPTVSNSLPFDIRPDQYASPRQPAIHKPYWVNWNDWHDLHNGEVPDYVTNRAST